jgi:hypothetical protein
MSLEAAIQKHEEWKARFLTAMTQHLMMDPVIIGKDNYCQLGKWFHGEGKTQFGNLRSYVDCVSSHALFHVEAAKVAQTINARNFVEAENMLGNGSPLTNASIEVARALVKFKEEAKL